MCLEHVGEVRFWHKTEMAGLPDRIRFGGKADIDVPSHLICENPHLGLRSTATGVKIPISRVSRQGVRWPQRFDFRGVGLTISRGFLRPFSAAVLSQHSRKHEFLPVARRQWAIPSSD